MHIDFALPDNGDLAAGFEQYKRKAASAVMDYGLHMAVTTWNKKCALQWPPLGHSWPVRTCQSCQLQDK